MTGPRRWLLGLAAALWLSVGLAAPSLAAKSISVRGWAHSEFGRLVFEWEAPVTYSARLAGGRLIIDFDSPVTVSLAEISRNLSGYVRKVALSRDRRTVTAEVTSGFKLRDFINRNVVIVDLVRTAPGAAAAPRRPARAARLTIRTGQHQRYGRLVFDWKAPVAYTARKKANEVVIRFDRAAAVNTAQLRRDLPDQVRAVATRKTRRGFELRLKVAKSSRVRHFRDGARVVVDVIGGARTETARSPSGAKGKKKTAKKSPIKTATTRREAARPPPATDPQPKQAAPSTAAAETFRPLVIVGASKRPGGITLRFNWREDTALAAYRRGSRLWLLFDKPARLGLGSVEVTARGVIDAVKQMPTAQTSWLRLDLPRWIEARVSREKKIWVLELTSRKTGSDVPGPTTKVQFDRRPSPRQKVRIPVPANVRTFAMFDPDIGDELFITPTPDPRVALPRRQRFLQFELLPSIAGIVVAKHADPLAVRLNKAAIEISSPDGLILSSARDLKSRNEPKVPDGPRRPLSHIKEWRAPAGADIARVQQRMIRRIIKAPKPKRNRMRMELARFYLAHQKPGAAIGVLDIIRRQDLSYERDLDYRALRGAASLLLGHYGEAATDLTFSFLKKDSSVAPWRASLAAEKGDWGEANRLFQRADAILADYPDWLANRLLLQAAEAALTVDDLASAKKRLGPLRRAGVSGAQGLQLDYLQAFLLKKQGKVKPAVEMWGKLAGSEDRKVRAKSAFAQTESLLEKGDIDVTEAVKRLERLTFAWRGDAFEFDLLRRLGDLYVQGQNHRDALTRYRQAASYFDSVEGTEAITHRMSEMFNGLYLKGGADKLPAVRALALYEEFRELTPPGKAGDKMIRRLADRLVRADLLNEAAQLLAHQVEFRLKGAEKAEIGARLAMIRLLDLKPTGAINALDKSVVDGLRPDLQRRRAHLRARALNQIGRGGDAILAIKGDTTPQAELIRLAVHWRTNDWRAAAGAIERILNDAAPEELGEEETELVLQWSVALALAKDWKGLHGLRSRFAGVMKSSPQGDAFAAIAGRGSGNVPDYKTLAKRAGDLDTFEAFMSSYRERVRDSRAKAVN